MSPALPVIKPKECLRALEKAGFYVDHRTGSHTRLFHRTKVGLRVTIPMHGKDLRAGTLKSILRQAELSVDEFLKLL